jgi:hypothetical protein
VYLPSSTAIRVATTLSAPSISPIGSTSSDPLVDTMITSRPAAWCFSISATASSYTSGSTMLCKVSATISLTVSTSQPAQSSDMNCRIFSIWSWSAPPTR